MSFKQIEKQKEMFFRCFAIIENINNLGHWLCCCKFYSGCQTINNYLRKKKICCYCQFNNSYNSFLLHHMKRNYNKLRSLHDEIVRKINQSQFARNFVYNSKNFNLFRPFGYWDNAIDQEILEMKNFLFLFLDGKKICNFNNFIINFDWGFN